MKQTAPVIESSGATAHRLHRAQAPAAAVRVPERRRQAHHRQHQAHRLDRRAEAGQHAGQQPAPALQRVQATGRQRQQQRLGVDHREDDRPREDDEQDRRAAGHGPAPPAVGEAVDEHGRHPAARRRR